MIVSDPDIYIDDLLALPQRRLEALQDVARKQVDRIRQSPSLQREIERLEKSIHSIEQMLTRLREHEESEAAAADEELAAEGIVINPDVDDEAEPPRASGGRSRG